MSRRYYKLPPLTSLATFETAARHRSFKGAAEELGVTPGAVSHQIKFLETELGLSLFDRKHHGNNLTDHGESLFAVLQSSFTAISSTLANLRRSATDKEVIISATTAISFLWLPPHLAEFWKKHPEIPVNQHVTDNPDSQGIAVDLKICYGFVENESNQKHTLFQDELVPVCSPSFAREYPNVSVEDLAQAPLIHLRAKDKNWSNWFSWFNALGYKGKISPGTHVNNYMIALQAASDGMGIVLGWKHLCKPKIDSGELVVLGDTSIPAPSAIYIMSEKEDLLPVNFQHVYYPGFDNCFDEYGVCQRLYFCENTDLMLERLRNSVCTIYKKKPRLGTKTVEWEVYRRIKRYPSMLAGQCSYNFLFSPNFRFYIDVDYEGDTFIIRDAVKNGAVMHAIPNGLISLSLKGQSKSKAALEKLAKLMTFDDNTHLRVVNKGGVDCVYNFFTGKLVYSAAIDNFQVNVYNFKHIIHDPQNLGQQDTLLRLVAIMDQFKVLQNALKKQQKALGFSYAECVRAMYSHLYSVDYSNDLAAADKDTPQFIGTQMSFTYLDMQIIEKVLLEREFDLSNIDEATQIQQCFNIYPGMQTAFHLLAKTKLTNFDANSISQLFDVAAKAKENADVKKRQFYLPLIENIFGKTAIDLVFIDNPNVNLAHQFLKNIKHYHFLHSGPVINRIIPKAIEMGVPDIDIFLDSRLVTSIHLKSGSLSKQAIQEDKKKDCKGYKYGLTTADTWEDKDLLVGKLFDPNSYKKDITILYLDIPEIHLNTPIGKEFFEAVAESEDLRLFETKVVQILINYKWELIRPKVFRNYLYPYIVFLISFSAWSNVFYEIRHQQPYVTINFVLCGELVAFCIYFSLGEVKQFRLQGWHYFLDPWNQLDILPLGLTAGTAIWTCVDEVGVQFNGASLYSDVSGQLWREYLQSLAAILMWFKFIYFLRCTSTTGWLVRMIVEVMKDMGSFLIVYFITIMAFSDAFYSMSQGQVSSAIINQGKTQEDAEENFGFIASYPRAFFYTFLITLGEFDVSQYRTFLCYVYFFMCTLINLIIMLNLLIAVISETHSNVTSKQGPLKYQEICRIISDYMFLDDQTEESLALQKEQFILIAMETEKKELDSEALGFKEVLAEVKAISKWQKEHFKGINEDLAAQKKTIDEIKGNQEEDGDDYSMNDDEIDNMSMSQQ